MGTKKSKLTQQDIWSIIQVMDYYLEDNDHLPKETKKEINILISKLEDHLDELST